MSAIHHAALLLATLFHTVLQASWQGALAIVLVLLVRQLLGARVPARWHYLLWFLVLIRLLAPASVLPHSPTSLENIRSVARPFEPQQLPPATQKASNGMTVMMPLNLPASPGVASLKQPEAAAFAMANSFWSWQASTALVWLVGVISFSLWLGVCSLQLRRRVRQGAAPVDAALVSLWQACCRRWLRRPAPPILMASWVHSPALVGAWRPTLLLPRQATDTFSTQDWEHVFAHEIAHLRWRDHWTQLLLLSAWCVHWFNPVVWLGLRRLRADRELAADEWVLRHLQGDGALAYGETLFKTLVQRPARLTFQPGMVGISEDGAQMKQRLRRIAAFLPQRRILGSMAGLAVVLALGSVVLGQSSPAPSVFPSSKEIATPQLAAPAAVSSVESLAAEARKFSDDLLAAARRGDATAVGNLLNTSFSPRPAKFSEDAATAMLDDLVRQRELATFTILHDQLKQTNYGKDWKPSDVLLVSLVKDRRTDFLEVLLARRLDFERLKTAAKSADQPTADWIARRVAEVTKQRDDVEALEKAADKGDLSAMKALIEGGADVNGVGKDDHTPLLHTVFKNQLEAAQYLLDHGALVDKPRYPGWDYTPLCLVNSVPMAELLKKNGANVHAKLFRRDVSILTYVVKWANTDVVAWFLQQGINPKMIKDNKENLLFGLKDGQTAKLLLDAGVDSNQVNEFGQPPICYARSAEVAQALVDHGAKLVGFEKPLLPMMMQFASGEAVEFVLKAQGAVDHALLQRSLMEAAFMDRDDVVRVLLKYGADPNEPTDWPDGRVKTLPLFACTINPCAKTAQVLIDAGADPNAGEHPGAILLNALGNGHKEVVAILRKAGARGMADLAFAVSSQDKAKIKELLGSAPLYQENPAFWERALPSAARVGDMDTVRVALSKGVPPKTGQADAFAEAAGEGQDEVLTVLLATRKPGDDPALLNQAIWNAVFNSHPNENRRTAEHFERCVQMLLDAGIAASKAFKGLMGAAVFTRGLGGGNPHVIEMLVRAGADPNPVDSPEGQPTRHLLDSVREAYAKGQCSASVVETLVKLSRLAPHPATGEATPRVAEPTPAATPPEQANGAEKPSAMFGRSVGADGMVSMADGTPLGIGEIEATAYSFRGMGGFLSSSMHVERGLFSLYLDKDTTSATVAVASKGCAVAFAGPFDAANMDQLEHLHIKLTRGYTAAVQVVDATGHPVAGAHLRPYYACPGKAELSIGETTTNASGNAAIEHIGEAPLSIRVLADGFQADEVTGLRLDPANPYRWTLQPTPPLRGTITAAATGQLIAGAKIKLAGVRGPHDESHLQPWMAPLLATADTQGRFALATLRLDSTYYLFVEAPGYSGAYVAGVKLEPSELKVVLGPELLIHGKIVHVPPSMIHMGKIYLNGSQTFTIEHSGEVVGWSQTLDAKGALEFTAGPFYTVQGKIDLPEDSPFSQHPVMLRVDGRQVGFKIEDLPKSGYILDLAPESTKSGDVENQ